jgi:ParB family chromosome partitioning protein
MTPKKKGLGKGLDALFAVEKQSADTQEEVTPNQLPLVNIDPNPNQPRKQFDEEKLKELSDSIATHGMLQPLLVTPRNGRYMLVAGERRWRAARMAGLAQVPALIMSLTEKEVAELSLIENLQRDDLNALEEAQGIAQLMEQFSMTQEEAAQRLGRSRPAVANALRLLQLAPEVQEMLRQGQLSAGHGRALAGIQQMEQQVALAQEVISQGLSVRQLEELLRKKKSRRVVEKPAVAPEFTELEDKLMRAFGTRVVVKGNLDKGRIILEYFQRDDLERIYEIATQWTADSE